MAKCPAELKAEKPKKTLEREITIDKKTCLVSLIKGMLSVAAAVATQSPLGVADLKQFAVDCLSAFNLKAETPQERAYLLINRALARALTDLLHAAGAPFRETLTCLEKEVKNLHTSEGVIIDDAFFKHPGEIELLRDVRLLLIPALTKVQQERYWGKDKDPEELAAKLPAYFTYSLGAEWLAEVEFYQPVRTASDTPFNDAMKNEWAWETYHRKLEQKVEEPVFGETAGLRDLYVPLNGYVQIKKERHVVALHEALKAWLDNEPDRPLRMLCGGPGSGKTSLVRMFAAEIVKTSQRKVLVIPLYAIDLSGKQPDKAFQIKFIEKAVERFIEKHDLKMQNPCSAATPAKDLLLIFDGLDELEEQGGDLFQSVTWFIQAIDNFIVQKNARMKRLKVLLVGRTPVVENGVTSLDFPEERVFHLLPYFLTRKEKERTEEKYTYIDPGGFLKKDLREIWWQQFLANPTRKAQYRAYKSFVLSVACDAITVYPLLNYLFVLSYTALPPGETLDSINQIYHHLLCGTFNREYAEVDKTRSVSHGKQHQTVRDLAPETFCEALEKIALAAWKKGNQRAVSTHDVEAFCHALDADGLFAKLVTEQNENPQILRLFVAFFFRCHSEQQEEKNPTFVFTHKTFFEYLTARGVVRAMKQLIDDLAHREVSRENAFQKWLQVTAGSPLTEEIITFISGELKAFDRPTLESYQKALHEIVDSVISQGIPCSNVSSLRGINTREIAASCLYAEATLFILLNCCATISRQIGEAFSEATNQLFRQWYERTKPVYDILPRFLNGMNLAGIDLKNVRLDLTDLAGTNLTGANLIWANLTWATLKGSNLTEANLLKANLTEANLTEANLTEANLTEANLTKASLTGASLTEANLTNVDLAEANLKGANLKGANLKGANLTKVDLAEANLTEANLKGADLTWTDLTWANLKGANLTKVDLADANLKGADLTWTDLTWAKLTETQVEHADFRQAMLSEDQKRYIREHGGIVDQ